MDESNANCQRLPFFVQFVESAGGDLRPRGNRSSVALNVGHFAESGRQFYEITELSKLGIPTVTITFGSSARGAYQPGMSDYGTLKNSLKYFWVVRH